MFPSERQLRRSIKVVHKLVDVCEWYYSFFMSQDVIEARLKDPKLAEKDDLLSLFINEASSDGEHMVATIFQFRNSI